MIPAVTSVTPPRRVALVSLGCARNDVDSEELAGRLAAAGWQLVDQPEQAAVTVVNTCGFIEAAKKDSIDTLLDVADRVPEGAKVVAVGCMAQRYGRELAEALPEAAAVLGFDDYAAIDQRLAAVVEGEILAAHQPHDRRAVLPLPEFPPEQGTTPPRYRLTRGPSAPLKLASGCDRRCAFCAIPLFRGSFTSRPPEQVVAEARQLAEQGVRELVLVSENTTSYGKDLRDLRALEKLLPQLTAVPGVEWVRLNYLQPAEMRPSLIEAIATTPGVVPYFDLSFQHASPTVLRQMRRFGGTEAFLELLDSIRAVAPLAGVRTNVIVGFPGETEVDLAELERFLAAANLDSVGVFGYSDEEGTEAVSLPDKLPTDEIAARVDHLMTLTDELTVQRAQQRIGEVGPVLIEEVEAGEAIGRSQFQGPEVDGVTTISGLGFGVGQLVTARVVDSEGVDLRAEVEV